MKLPVKVSGSVITDADRKVIVTTTAANGDYWLSDFTTDAENNTHLAEIAAALNEAATLRAQVAALVDALKPFADYFTDDLTIVGGGTIVAPAFTVQHFKDAKAAIAAAEGSAE